MLPARGLMIGIDNGRVWWYWWPGVVLGTWQLLIGSRVGDGDGGVGVEMQALVLVIRDDSGGIDDDRGTSADVGDNDNS